MTTEFAILDALKSFPNGASIDQIISSIDLDVEKRTIQRRLAKLKKQGKILVTGRARAVRYHLPIENEMSILSELATQPEKQTLGEAQADLIPLTSNSKQLLAELLKPIQTRKPVGYNREFLKSYRPNIDRYLTEQEIKRLTGLGNTAKLNQPAGTYAKQILNRLLIDLSWNSSRLEGNTYTLLDTERLLSLGEIDESKSALETTMIINHKEAIEFIVESAAEIGFNRYTFQNLHALLANNLLPDTEAPGRLRSFAVGISKSIYTPLAIPQLIEESLDLLLQKAGEIENPFEQSFFLMVQLPYLQPFDDVNKRVSRLAANISLIKDNLSPLSFIDVPDSLYIQGTLAVYELNRIDLLKDVFLWAYERSAARYSAIRQSLGEPDPFRVKYRQPIRILISRILSGAMNPKLASETITDFAIQIIEPDRPKFIEAVETELMSLHEGNFARYWVSPNEFKQWKAGWFRPF